MSQYVVFQLGENRYGLHIEDVSSIEMMQSITSIPGTNSYVKGVVNLRGALTPVIRMHEYFHTDINTEPQTSKIIVVLDKDNIVGLIVDEAKNVMEIPDKKIEPITQLFSTIHSEYLEGLANVNETTIAILSTKRLLNISKEITASNLQEPTN